jgi:MOSC domain-containing protein YiiM
MSGVLASIQVGRPRVITERDPWVTSFFKVPVTGRVRLNTNNLDGDEQADLSVHGGPDKAICVYSADHFSAWSTTLHSANCGPGSFGENFSVSGLTEHTVFLGDVYQVGTSMVQVSQPRGPCWKLARRWRRMDLPRLVLKTGRTGWYFRVLQPGYVSTEQRLSLVDRPCAQWSIARVNEFSYAPVTLRDRAARRALADCAVLADTWRATLLRN